MTNRMFAIEDAFADVLANEATCRLMFNKLKEQGVKFNPDPDTLHHSELAELAIKLLSELKRLETK